MKYSTCDKQLPGVEPTQVEYWPKGFVSELLTLLDRIEVEDDHELAAQRFAIAEKYGFDVEWGEPISGQMN